MKQHLPEFAHSLCQRFEDEGVALLLAGGWAVCFHGYARHTLDIDWVCALAQHQDACALMARLGFRKDSYGMASRFKFLADLSVPFVDLLWVDEATFAVMAATAVRSPEPLAVPMLGFRSLVAMKLHALKDAERRGEKDLLDLRKILTNNPDEIGREELREMCLRYAGPDAFAQLGKLR